MPKPDTKEGKNFEARADDYGTHNPGCGWSSLFLGRNEKLCRILEEAVI